MTCDRVAGVKTSGIDVVHNFDVAEEKGLHGQKVCSPISSCDTFRQEQPMAYKIELRYLGGWGDAEWIDAESTRERHLRFPTVALAQAALDDFFADVRRAVAAGNMEVEERQADYRIVAAHE
jgi:hypothetical protein